LVPGDQAMGRQALRFQGWHPTLGVECCPDRAVIRLIAGVMVWWLLIVGAITFTVPSPASVSEVLALAPGHVARISTPSGAGWLAPIDRATYYEVDRALLDDAGETTSEVRARPGWLVVLHGQSVRVIDVDRTAVQVELLQRLAAPLIVAFSPGHGFRGGDNMINADEECCRGAEHWRSGLVAPGVPPAVAGGAPPPRHAPAPRSSGRGRSRALPTAATSLRSLPAPDRPTKKPAADESAGGQCIRGMPRGSQVE